MSNPTKQDWTKIVRFDAELVKHIRAQQNSYRSVGIIPSWANFVADEFWWEICKTLTTNKERAKYQAWWNLLFEYLRDPRDEASLMYAVGVMVQEKLRRSYGKNRSVAALECGVEDEAHARKIEEYVRTHFESLNFD